MDGVLASLPREHGGVDGGTGDALIRRVRVCDAKNWADRNEFEFGESIGLEMDVHVVNPVSDAIFRYTIDAAHYRFICNFDSSYDAGVGLMDVKPGSYRVRTTIKSPRALRRVLTMSTPIFARNPSKGTSSSATKPRPLWCARRRIAFSTIRLAGRHAFRCGVLQIATDERRSRTPAGIRKCFRADRSDRMAKPHQQSEAGCAPWRGT